MNGHVNKCDANFMNNFQISRVPNTNIFFGSYPAKEVEIMTLKKAGVHSVLDLLS